MNKTTLIAIIAGLMLLAGAVYVYKQSAVTPPMNEGTVMPTLSETDSFEDIEQDLQGTEVIIEDSEYSKVESDINGL